MSKPTWEDLAPRLEAFFIEGGGAQVPDDLYQVTWDLLADSVEASLSDAQERLRLFELEADRAGKRAEIGRHPLRWVQSVVRETRRQVEQNGRATLVRAAPPPLPEDRVVHGAEGWSVDWGQVEDPGRLVYVYTPRSSGGGGDGPDYDRAKRLILDDETWGQALDGIEAWAEAWYGEHGEPIEEAIERDRRLEDLLRFKWNVLDDVIYAFGRYGHVERRLKEGQQGRQQRSARPAMLEWFWAVVDVLFKLDEDGNHVPRECDGTPLWKTYNQERLLREAEERRSRKPKSALKYFTDLTEDELGGLFPEGDMTAWYRLCMNTFIPALLAR